ncbi:c-type cytochrome [Pseudoduganella sp. OTU4001]|uniref:c-type cytochrome n=1 Tax=Pseudoduganella sp. OTU4001 TaxID=3043854 RepID=UPI00313B0C43
MHLQQIARCVTVAGALLLCACQPEKPAPPRLDGGNPQQGKRLLAQYQCGSCHRIPDVESARGLAGPSLERFALRSYVAGRWSNRHDWLVRWITSPQSMDPGSFMPNMGVSADDARHMAAYLYTLK